MKIKNAKHIASLLSSASAVEGQKYRLDKHIDSKKLSGFHQWADDKPCEGAFLFKDGSGSGFWLVLIDWRKSENFYVVLFTESKSGPIAEIHRVAEKDDVLVLHWRYSPTKRDSKNDERKSYFAEAFLSVDVQISIPKHANEVDDFIDELFVLSESRAKADRLDPDRPVPRIGFPEGKQKEKLHLTRERNRELVRQAKLLALNRDGVLRCACCDFDFLLTYGEVGRGFIEAHHTKPISDLHEDGEETQLADLAMVCPNCHKMLHRRRPWLGMNELNELLAINNTLKRTPR